MLGQIEEQLLVQMVREAKQAVESQRPSRPGAEQPARGSDGKAESPGNKGIQRAVCVGGGPAVGPQLAVLPGLAGAAAGSKAAGGPPQATPAGDPETCPK